MSKEINVKNVLLAKYGSTDSEFIKRLPLNAVYYAKGNYFDIRGFGEKENKSSRTYLSERIKRLEDYIHNKTNWNLVSGYVDISRILVHHYKDDVGSYNWLSGKIALEKLLDDAHYNSDFSIIVIDNILQLTRYLSYVGEFVEELALNQVFIFCLDTEEIITFTKKNFKVDISKSSVIEGETSFESDYDF